MERGISEKYDGRTAMKIRMEDYGCLKSKVKNALHHENIIWKIGRKTCAFGEWYQSAASELWNAADRKTVYSDIDIIQVRGTNGDVIAAAENLNY